ncbi:MAG: hypothetical protein WC683_19825 [bacterium]
MDQNQAMRDMIVLALQAPELVSALVLAADAYYREVRRILDERVIAALGPVIHAQREEAAPPKPQQGPPPDLEALVTLVYEKFPRTGHSNPKHFALVNGCSGEDGDQDGLRVNALRHAFTKCVQLGFLEKLVEGEEYCWCGDVEVAP